MGTAGGGRSGTSGKPRANNPRSRSSEVRFALGPGARRVQGV